MREYFKVARGSRTGTVLKRIENKTHKYVLLLIDARARFLKGLDEAGNYRTAPAKHIGHP